MVINSSQINHILKDGLNALLVNPPIYDYITHTHSDSTGKWGQPAGLLRISSYLKQRGCNVALIDCLEERENKQIPFSYRKIIQIDNLSENQYHIGLSWESIKGKLEGCDFYPDLVFITATMTYWWKSSKDMVDIIRAMYPLSKIIIGGIYPTLMPDHAQEHTGADIVFQGEIANTFDLWSDFSLYEKKQNYAVILTSKGCPWDCAYCAQSKINTCESRYRKPSDIADEIENKFRKYGVTNFVFFADNFLANKKHFKEMLFCIRNRNMPITLDAPKGVEPDLLDKQILLLMKKAGWIRVNLALETTCDMSRENWNRKHTNEQQFQRAVALCKDAGYHTKDLHAFVLYGMPGENLDLVRETAEFIHSQQINITPMPYTPVPGSAMYNFYLPYIQKKVSDIELLNERLFPFATYNGYSLKEYLLLEKYMESLNSLLNDDCVLQKNKIVMQEGRIVQYA